MIGPCGQMVAIDQECNVDHLGPKRYIFHFYEPIEKTVDRLVNRSSKRSSQWLPSMH